jgi:hypothetical protein
VLADKAERDLFRRRILDDLARPNVLKASTIGCRMILVRDDERIRGLAGGPRPSEAKAVLILEMAFAARLKPCPDTNLARAASALPIARVR